VHAVALSEFRAAKPIATTRVDSAASACASVHLTRSNSAWPHVCQSRQSSTNAQSAKLDSLVSSAVTTVACLCGAWAQVEHAHTVMRPSLLPT